MSKKCLGYFNFGSILYFVHDGNWYTSRKFENLGNVGIGIGKDLAFQYYGGINSWLLVWCHIIFIGSKNFFKPILGHYWWLA